MSHEVETMAYNMQETPWHGLGVPVDGTLSVPDMMKAAELDWKVKKQPMYILDAQGNPIRVDNKQALVRTKDDQDSVLSVVSDSWTPCQNTDAFSVFEEYVDRSELSLETAGSLKGGKIVWGLAKINQSFEFLKGDVTDNYLLLVNNHQFGKGIHVRSTPIRVVCNNTLSLSLGSASDVKASQNHRQSFNVDMMKDAIGMAKEKLLNYSEMAKFMSQKQFEDEKFKEFLNQVFPGYGKSKDSQDLSRNAQLAYDVVESQPGAEFGRGSWWQAFNAVTYLADHQLGRDSDARLTSAWFGANKDRKNKALELAVQYAETA